MSLGGTVSQSFRQSCNRNHTSAFGTLAAVAAVAGAAAVPALAVAQNTLDAARSCATIQDDTDRLDCYDRAFAGAAPAQTTPNEEPTTSAPPASSPLAAATERRPPRPATAPSPAAPATASPAPAVEPEDATPEIVPIVVVAVRQAAGNNVVFTTDAGEVWLQTDGRRNHLPDLPFAAEIRPGMMSSFFLVPKDRGRSIRVRRAD
jgi:hypothetical protein